jgi:hypothetical protein
MSIENSDTFLALLSEDNDERAKRVTVRLPGRFMLADKREFPCISRSVSPIMLRLEAEVKPSLNEHIVVYLRELGRIAGWVVRITPHGFAIVMDLTITKRERMDITLKWIAKNGLFEYSSVAA